MNLQLRPISRQATLQDFRHYKRLKPNISSSPKSSHEDGFSRIKPSTPSPRPNRMSGLAPDEFLALMTTPPTLETLFTIPPYSAIGYEGKTIFELRYISSSSGGHGGEDITWRASPGQLKKTFRANHHTRTFDPYDGAA